MIVVFAVLIVIIIIIIMSVLSITYYLIRNYQVDHGRKIIFPLKLINDHFPLALVLSPLELNVHQVHSIQCTR